MNLMKQQAHVEQVNKEMQGVLDRWEQISGEKIPLDSFRNRSLSNLASSPEELSRLAVFLLSEVVGKTPTVQSYLPSKVSQSSAVFDPRIFTELCEHIDINAPVGDSIAFSFDQPQSLKNAKRFPGSLEHVAGWLVQACDPGLPIHQVHPGLFGGLVRYAGSEVALPILRAQFGNYPGFVAQVLRNRRIGGEDELRVLREGLANLSRLPGVVYHQEIGKPFSEKVVASEIRKTIASIEKRLMPLGNPET